LKVNKKPFLKFGIKILILIMILLV